jgi:uncharacterized membrane protein YgcG
MIMKEENPMRIYKTKAFYVISLLLMTASLSCGTRVEDLSRSGNVNDFAGVLKRGISDELDVFTDEIQKKTNAEMVIVTLRGRGKTVKDEAEKLMEQWRIGTESPGKEGILILLDTRKKEMAIIVTPGLGNIITSTKINVMLDVLATPRLDQSNPGGAVAACVIQIAKILRDDMGVEIDPIYHDLSGKTGLNK